MKNAKRNANKMNNEPTATAIVAESTDNGATEARIEKARQRRLELRELSDSLKALAKITGEDDAVNRLLIEYY